MGSGGHNVPLIRYKDGRIRKLIPCEYFRFQGFIDEYLLPADLCDGFSANLVQLIYVRLIAILDGVGTLSNNVMDIEKENPTTKEENLLKKRKTLIIGMIQKCH